MKKLLYTVVLVCLMVTLVIPAFAVETDDIQCTDCNQYLSSVEIISNSELVKELPSDLAKNVEYYMKYGTLPSTVTRGSSAPDEGNQWDLRYDGKYYFEVITSSTPVFSNYVYTGHDGSVTMYLDEIADSPSKYTFKLYKTERFNTEVFVYDFPHNETQKFELVTFDSDDFIFFSIIPNGTYTELSKSSYIMS